MKVIIIRHAAVNMKWEKSYTSTGFDEACRQYEKADIISDEIAQADPDRYRILTSTEKRALQTGMKMFGENNTVITPTDLLNEVPLRSFCETKKKLPVWLYFLMGRIQWWFGIPRQEESRKQTRERVRKAIALIDSQDSDCVVISHGFMIRQLLNGYSTGKGYTVTRGSMLRIPPLSRIRVTMTKDHCGGCMHNCFLENAGCDIGKQKAKEKAIKEKQRHQI